MVANLKWLIMNISSGQRRVAIVAQQPFKMKHTVSRPAVGTHGENLPSQHIVGDAAVYPYVPEISRSQHGFITS